MIPSIWPAELERPRGVPAFLAGHTLVLSENHREVLHVVPRGENHQDERVRLRVALAKADLVADYGGTNDTGLQALWAEPAGADRAIVLALPDCVGTVQVEMQSHRAVITFKPKLIEPVHGWFLLAVVHDADLNPDTGYWNAADRDRWLDWVGISPR